MGGVQYRCSAEARPHNWQTRAQAAGADEAAPGPATLLSPGGERRSSLFCFAKACYVRASASAKKGGSGGADEGGAKAASTPAGTATVRNNSANTRIMGSDASCWTHATIL